MRDRTGENIGRMLAVGTVMITFVLGWIVGSVCPITEVKGASAELSGPLYITAAHIPQSDFPYLTQIYVDTTRDTAYYLRRNYEYTVPEIGAQVYINGASCIVESIEPGIGFYVRVGNDMSVYRGMSGSRVCNNKGEEFAFVSKLKGRSHLLCIPII